MEVGGVTTRCDRIEVVEIALTSVVFICLEESEKVFHLMKFSSDIKKFQHEDPRFHKHCCGFWQSISGL